jgi:Tol biopolymer transport system component
MTRTHLIGCFLIFFTLAISACSSENTQPSGVGTPTTPPDEYENFPTAIASNSVTIPITWSALNLTGRLVHNLGAVDAANNYIVQIRVLDLVTGHLAVIYTAPVNASIYYISVSPDGRQVVMSYSPPSEENPEVVQGIYTMPLDGSEQPQLLFTPPTPQDQYTQAEWSPDGKYIYYAHVNHQIPNDPDRAYPLYDIFRRAYPGGEQEAVATAAHWPRLSSDSRRLVYVSLNPLSGEHKLMTADADGGNAQQVVLSGPYIPEDIDAPIFSPDGQSILFSGSVPGESYQPNWFEKLVGIQIAKANGEPSDWWSVPVGGGEITQLTNIRHTGLYGSISPDNTRIASSSRDNIFVMNFDGSELTVLVPELRGFTGTLSWIP